MDRAIFNSTRGVTHPAKGATGYVYQAPGFYDDSSAEYGAWMFCPDGENNYYYIGEEDFQFTGEREPRAE